jgi:hypothetical protein
VAVKDSGKKTRTIMASGASGGTCAPRLANGLQGMSLKKSGRLVEVRPDEELPAAFSFSLRRILVPIALDKASAVACDYASTLAQRFGSELAVLYAFEDSDYAQSSNIEAELRTFCSALRLRHLEVRVFLRPGPTGALMFLMEDCMCDTKIFLKCSAIRSRVNANQSRPMQNICWSFLAGPVAIA